MKTTHLFVTFNKGFTSFRASIGDEGIASGSNPASEYNYSTALEDHYENLASYIKRFQPTSIEIRNDLLVN